MSDVVNNSGPSDGFDDDAGEGEQFPRVIQGEKWSFSNEGTWVNADGELISPDREVVVVKLDRVLQKWVDQMPVEGCTRFLTAGERVDVEQLNETCPKSEWSEDLNGKPRGPWQTQNLAYMVDLQTMQKFTYPTSTVGGGICFGDLKDAVQLMRKFRGPGVYPVVSVGTKPMKTRFSVRPRPRPHFVIKRWISFGPDGTALPPASPPSLQPPSQPEHPDKAAAAAPDQAKTEAATKAKTTKAKSAVPSGAQVVEEPTLREELDDDIPW